MLVSVADTSALYAAADRGDANHERSLAVLERPDLRLVIPILVAAEASQLIGARLGGQAEATFLRELASQDVDVPPPEDWSRIAEVVEIYADFPLGGIDASVVALAERLDAEVVVTFDRRHFAAVRPRHREAFQLLPE